ncbi:hypothetical protein [uncultured Methylobacterium sp.]|uniref:hypothetical protein n=1 Tax=uncultured Methylobacterium sp. TaxID=157278 RepID=UPI0035CBD338
MADAKPLAPMGSRICEILAALDDAIADEARLRHEERRLAAELAHAGRKAESLRGDLDVALASAAGAAGLA